MMLLTSSTADLVPLAKKKILTLSSGIWGRAWIFWAPFIGALSMFGPFVPVSVMAAFTVIGGVLFTKIGCNQVTGMKNQTKNLNMGIMLDKGTEVCYFLLDKIFHGTILENCNLLEPKS